MEERRPREKKKEKMKGEKKMKRGRPKKKRSFDTEDEEYVPQSSQRDHEGPRKRTVLSLPSGCKSPVTLSEHLARCSSGPIADSEATLFASCLESPVQSTNGNPVTLALVKRIFMGEKISSEDFNSEPPIIAPELPSEQGIICSDKVAVEVPDTSYHMSCEKADGSISAKNVLDLKKFSSDLLAQTQMPGPPMQVAPPSEEEMMVDNHSPENDQVNVAADMQDKTANGNAETLEQSVSPSGLEVLTVISTLDGTYSEKDEHSEFGKVEGYKVKKELEPLLKAIFRKYGDIAKSSTFSEGSRSCLLELACSIYKRLEDTKFAQMTELELKSLSGQIGDLEFVNVEIGWLRERLDLICTSRKMYEGASTLEDVESRTSLMVDEKKKRVGSYEKELETCMAAMNALRGRLHQEQVELAQTVAVVEQIKLFYKNTLVHGLL